MCLQLSFETGSISCVQHLLETYCFQESDFENILKAAFDHGQIDTNNCYARACTVQFSPFEPGKRYLLKRVSSSPILKTLHWVYDIESPNFGFSSVLTEVLNSGESGFNLLEKAVLHSPNQALLLQEMLKKLTRSENSTLQNQSK